MNYVAAGKALAVVVVAAVLIATITWAVKTELGVHRDAGRYVACGNVAAGKADLKGICPAPLADQLLAAQREASCDQALTATRVKGGVPSLCSGPVRDAVTERDAGRVTITDQQRDLAAARTATTEAVKRATARATDTAQRRAHADQVIDHAPLGSDGLRRCDAQCLRDLGSPAAAGA